MTLLNAGSRRDPAGDPAPDTDRGPTVATMVYDVDGYSRSVEGVEIEVVRTGRGLGPTVVRSTSTQRVIATSPTIGFPMAARGTIGDNHVLAAVARSTASGSRWCGIDLEPGMVVVYGPGAAHTGMNPPGSAFSFVTVERSTLAELAEAQRLRFQPPPPGQVHALGPRPMLDELREEITGFVDAAEANVGSERRRESALLDALTVVLSDDRRAERVGDGRRIDSRLVVRACVEYAESVGRVPSVSEMCLVAHVSERRLRTAFATEYGMSPSRYVRLWGLAEARRRLTIDLREGKSVSRTAYDVGFNHLGRFAARYKGLFGESPSETLRSGA